MALSDTWLKANHGKERPHLAERGDRDGLGVRVTPKGKITFQLRFRSAGKFSRLDLGSYPLMTLKQARDEAQRLRAQHEQGHDPRIVRLLERQAINKVETVETLFRAWHAAYCTNNKKGPRLRGRKAGKHTPNVVDGLARHSAFRRWSGLIGRHRCSCPEHRLEFALRHALKRA